MNKYLLLLCASSLFVLPSCTAVGLAVGAGATAGIAAAQEGGISMAASDARIQLEINDLWFNYSFEAFRKLDLTINQGRVLVTGVVQNPEHRVEAIRLAWQPVGVEQVINEVQVAESEGIKGFARDTWVTTRLRTALTFDSEILSINYSIDTVQGTVYLMGFAQDRTELNRVIERARSISGVRGVVSYVKIVDGSALVEEGAPVAWERPIQEGGTPDVRVVDSAPTPLLDKRSAPVQGGANQSDFSSPSQRAVTTQPALSSPSASSGLKPEDRPYIVREGVEAEEVYWNR